MKTGEIIGLDTDTTCIDGVFETSPTMNTVTPTEVLVLSAENGSARGLIEGVLPKIIESARPDLNVSIVNTADDAEGYLLDKRVQVAAFISSCYFRGGLYSNAHYCLPPLTETALALSTLPVGLISQASKEKLAAMTRSSRGNNFIGSTQSIQLDEFGRWLTTLQMKKTFLEPLVLDLERTVYKPFHPVHQSLRFF